MLDNELGVETPEHVELAFVLASIGNRFLACAIDHIIQGLLLFFILAGSQLFEQSFSALGARLGLNWIIALSILAAFVIIFGYFVIFETLWSGQTPGKRWMRLRVVREDARPITFYEAMIRNLVRIVDMMPIPSYFVGIVSIFLSPQYRRLGDYASGTVVVKERSTEAPTFRDLFESDKDLDQQPRLGAGVSIPAYALRSITKHEMRAVDAFLNRRATLDPQRRHILAYRVAAPLMVKLQLSPNEHPPEVFLEELSRQYSIQAKYLSN
jgi:uncharacterized RDD family membrane protein YckC